jgi:hypothetical protein
MIKDDAEQHVRHLVGVWLEERRPHSTEPSGLAFLSWLRSHHPKVLRFRTANDVNTDVLTWFEEETGQTWKR